MLKSKRYIVRCNNLCSSWTDHTTAQSAYACKGIESERVGGTDKQRRRENEGESTMIGRSREKLVCVRARVKQQGVRRESAFAYSILVAKQHNYRLFPCTTNVWSDVNTTCTSIQTRTRVTTITRCFWRQCRCVSYVANSINLEYSLDQYISKRSQLQKNAFRYVIYAYDTVEFGNSCLIIPNRHKKKYVYYISNLKSF